MITQFNMMVFITVAQTLNFSQAAKKLFMTRQGVSQQVKALETTLGTPLFARNANRIELTPAGLAYLDTFQRYLDHLRELKERFRLTEDGKTLVNIGIMRTLPVWEGIYQAENRCKDLGMNLDVRFYVYEPPELMDGLREHSLDLLLTMPLPIMWQEETYDSFQYDEMQQIMLVRKDHPLLDPKRSEEENITQILEQLPVATWDSDADIPGKKREFLNNWQGSGRMISSLEHYANADSAIMAAQKGECVLFGPSGWSAADNHLLAAFSLGKALDYHCIWCKNQENPCMNEFIKACKRIRLEERIFSADQGAS